MAVKNGKIEVVKELLKMNFLIDDPKSNGITALGIAAYRGSIEIMTLLI